MVAYQTQRNNIRLKKHGVTGYLEITAHAVGLVIMMTGDAIVCISRAGMELLDVQLGDWQIRLHSPLYPGLSHYLLTIPLLFSNKDYFCLSSIIQ